MLLEPREGRRERERTREERVKAGREKGARYLKGILPCHNS